MSIMCETMSNKLCWATTVIVRASDRRSISVDNLFSRYCLCGSGNATMKLYILRPCKGVPGIPYPFNYFKKYPISLEINEQISPKFIPIQKALYHHIPKSILNFHKSTPYQYKYLANILISPKTLQWPQYLGQGNVYTQM